jgi:hypothetical protein
MLETLQTPLFSDDSEVAACAIGIKTQDMFEKAPAGASVPGSA